MRLKDLLGASSKAQLQGYYLYWLPGKEMISVRERLAAELSDVMMDPAKVRRRFEGLSRAQQAFLITLLLRESYSGTVVEVRAQKHGRIIEDFEVESILKCLQEAGYIARVSGSGGYAKEVLCISEELAGALRRTVTVEERQPMEMLSLRTRLAAANGSGPAELAAAVKADEIASRIRRLSDRRLEDLVRSALEKHGGILSPSVLSHSGDGAPAGASFNHPGWRDELEGLRLGTTGILSLRDYGIDFQEEGLLVYQEIVYAASLAAALRGPENDREVSMGVDLIIDLDRVLEVLRREPLETTREGSVYKKIEDRIAGQFVTTRHAELFDGSPVNAVLELGRKLQFFEEEEHQLVVDPLRRRVWRKKPLLQKVEQVYDIYRNESRGQRWSFHQAALREIFLEHLKDVAPGRWLIARPLLAAAVAQYLLRLEDNNVNREFQERCTGDFRNETLMVPLSKLQHDLSYWVLHRLAPLGLIDVGYKEGSFHSLQLSPLGMRFFEITGEEAADRARGVQGSDSGSGNHSRRVLVNPDFEVLIYPEAPEEASWTMSLFADRLDSDRVKRYRITRESVKRGIVAGLSRDDMVGFLEANAHGAVPSNVLFSVREWTDGVELVRLQKVHLLRAQTKVGADRLAAILDARGIAFERLNETTVTVRGGKNERAVKELQAHFRDHGLFVE